jgi:uncharacterized membrane protein YsdA (DUF1294 family)
MLWKLLLFYNVVVFAVYAWDKWKAQHHAWRVPERTLLWLAFCAGAPGALGGIFLIHHKTRKPKFTVGVSAMLALQGALLLWGLTRGWW